MVLQILVSHSCLFLGRRVALMDDFDHHKQVHPVRGKEEPNTFLAAIELGDQFLPFFSTDHFSYDSYPSKSILRLDSFTMRVSVFRHGITWDSSGREKE